MSEPSSILLRLAPMPEHRMLLPGVSHAQGFRCWLIGSIGTVPGLVSILPTHKARLILAIDPCLSAVGGDMSFAATVHAAHILDSSWWWLWCYASTSESTSKSASAKGLLRCAACRCWNIMPHCELNDKYKNFYASPMRCAQLLTTTTIQCDRLGILSTECNNGY